MQALHTDQRCSQLLPICRHSVDHLRRQLIQFIRQPFIFINPQLLTIFNILQKIESVCQHRPLQQSHFRTLKTRLFKHREPLLYLVRQGFAARFKFLQVLRFKTCDKVFFIASQIQQLYFRFCHPHAHLVIFQIGGMLIHQQGKQCTDHHCKIRGQKCHASSDGKMANCKYRHWRSVNRLRFGNSVHVVRDIDPSGKTGLLLLQNSANAVRQEAPDTQRKVDSTATATFICIAVFAALAHMRFHIQKKQKPAINSGFFMQEPGSVPPDPFVNRFVII